MALQLIIPGHPPRKLLDSITHVTVGRGEENLISIDDPSLSRFHGKITWDGQRWVFEDLNSRNGSKHNGQRVSTPCPIVAGDQLELGRVRVGIEMAPDVKLDSAASQLFPMEQVRREFITLESQGGKPLEESLNLLQEIALDLLHDVPLESQVRRTLERLQVILKPRRVVALLRAPGGEIKPFVFVPELRDDIPVSRTAIASICEDRQALLVQDRLSDLRVRDATSLVFQSVRSLMAAPLECEGNIEGLLYADAGAGRNPFEKRDLALLATVAHMLAARMRTHRLLVEREKMRAVEQEMELARQIQGNLLPKGNPEVAGYEFFGRSIPSWQVGGDLFGYWQTQSDRFYGAIADVSGKGVGPGLLMACLMAYMNGSTRLNPTTADLATWLSRDLAGHTSKNRFATAFLFCLDPQLHWMDYTNAGHNPAIILRASGEIVRLESQGLPLALFPGQSPYGQARVSLNPGDLLFLYTDGVNEATNSAGDEFGLERLEHVLREAIGSPLNEMVQCLDRCTQEHTQGHPFGDDRTIFVLRRI